MAASSSEQSKGSPSPSQTVLKPSRLSGWDFATWRSSTESQTMRSTMIAVYVLDRAPDWKRLVDRYDRASRIAPVLRMKVVEGPVPIANPRLVVDENFDLSFHLRRFRMPDGSTWDDVLADARRQGMTDFDLDRSLWRVTVLEGLPGGKAAIIFKLHHAIADGQGAMKIGQTLVDLSAEGADLGPMPDAPAPGDLSSKRDFGKTMIRDNANWVATTVTELAKGAPSAAVNAAKSPKETVSKVVDVATSIAKYSKVPSKPASPIMTKRSANFHCDAFELPFSDVRDAGKAQGHSVNDVFLASIAAGMELYHEKHNTSIDALHISMPISTRTSADGGGNAVGIAHFDLPLNEPDSNKLMDTVHQIVAKWRAEPVIGMSNQLGEASRFIPTDFVISAATSSDLTASNVPGPPVQLWLAGAKVEHIIPFPPLIGAAVFVAMLTYNKQACIGLSIDDAAIPDPDVLVRCLADGFAKVTGKPVKLGGFVPEPRKAVKKTAAKKAAKKTAKKAAKKTAKKAAKKTAKKTARKASTVSSK